MSNWGGEELCVDDREEAMANYDPGQIDEEFLPLVDEINTLTFSVTVQCCIGHLKYAEAIPDEDKPANNTGAWGYLLLRVTEGAAEWLSSNLGGEPWLWIEGSQLYVSGAAEPATTENGSIAIAFAWDASRWPIPGQVILKSLKEFHARYSL